MLFTLLSVSLAATCEVVVICDGVQVGDPVPLPALPVCDTGAPNPRNDDPTGDTGLVGATGPTGDTGSTATVPERVVIVLFDDVGYGALTTQTPYAHPTPPAPNLDSLAASGRRFTHALAAPNCSPARASLFTGREGSRDGVSEHGWSLNEPAGAAAWPTAFRSAGWNTHFVGKWHLTGMSGNPGAPVLAPQVPPTVLGFDTWIANEGSFDDGAFLMSDETGAILELNGETADVLFEETRLWLEAQTGPSLAVVSLSAGHYPYVAPQADWDAFAGYIPQADARGYWAEVRAADRALGTFVDTLEAGGLLDSTLLVVTSDNGARDNAGFAGHPNGDMAGFKGSVQEGALRVPFVVHWPAGGISGVETRPIRLTDIGHTVAGLTGVPWAHLTPTDGIDASGLVKGGSHTRTAGLGFTSIDGDRAWFSADGTWKLEMADGVYALYDLINDPGAAVDVSSSFPVELATFTADLAAWDASVTASKDCSDYASGDCGFTRKQKHFPEMTIYDDYKTEWCNRPEFANYGKCAPYRN